MSTTADDQPPDSPSSQARDGEAVVVRSEEQMKVTHRWGASRRVRFGKRVVTETRIVEVRREEFFIEEDPLNGPGLQVSDAPGLDRPIEILLYEEQISTVAVSVERVTVSVEKVAGTAEVSADVRREQIRIADPAKGAEMGPTDPVPAVIQP